MPDVVALLVSAAHPAGTVSREDILASGQLLVGWYHTHPSQTFYPSVYDVDCHYSYLCQMKDTPLLACIIGS